MNLETKTAKTFFKHFQPPNDWDKAFELNPQTSQYYAILVKQYGKALADYYWNRRFELDSKKDYYYIELCKEISEKSEKFLKSRGIDIKRLI